MTLDVASKLGTVMQGIAVSFAAVFAIVQIVQYRRTRELELLMNIFADFHSDKSYDQRQRILYLSNDASWDDHDVFSDCLQASDLFQRMAFLVRQRAVRKGLVLRMYSGIIASCYESLAPFIEARRAATEVPNYAIDFQWLGNKAVRFRERRYGKSGSFRGSPSSSTPDRDDEQPVRTKVLCGVPCYNVAPMVQELTERLGAIAAHGDIDILIIDDGSTDQTPKLLALANRRVVFHDSNRGYGSAVKTAIKHGIAEGYDYVVIFPGDCQRAPRDLFRLVETAVTDQFDIVVGRKPSHQRGQIRSRRILSSFAGRAAKALWHPPYTDVTSGFKVYRCETIGPLLALLPNDYSFDIVLSIYAKRFDLSVYELDVAVEYPWMRSSIRQPIVVSVRAGLHCALAHLRRLNRLKKGSG